MDNVYIGLYTDLGNIINVNTTYKYTFYTANNNPWGLSYGSNSWKLEILRNNTIPYSNNINLHLLYTNNTQLTVGYCDLQLNTLSAGSQIRFKDVNGFLNISQLDIIGSSNFTIDGNTTQRLNTEYQAKLYVWIGGSSGGILLSL